MLAPLILFPHSDRPQMPRHLRKYYSFNKNVQILGLLRLLFNFGVRPQLLSTECDRRNLLLTIIVNCVDSACDETPKSNRKQASFL